MFNMQNGVGRAFLGVGLLAALVVGGGCASEMGSSVERPGLNAALWTQDSAEFDAVCIQTYHAAGQKLAAIVDEQGGGGGDGGKPLAVVLDVDETVLDNTPYQARLVKGGAGYSPETWNAWVREEQAAAIPGVARFVAEARQMSVDVFYVTNREAVTKEATLRNIEREVDPRVEIERILCKNENGWTSDKDSRRATVRETHEIVMLIGDDLGDFVSPVDGSPAERRAQVDDNRSKWGESWFAIPNPMYGKWERAVLGHSPLPKSASDTDKKLEHMVTLD
ncbi:MAG: hypothetical protein CMJ31_05575 [Phycisphaerae bacterium]|nr:hypothetical protein [Phycisphaerae bacterium]